MKPQFIGAFFMHEFLIVYQKSNSFYHLIFNFVNMKLFLIGIFTIMIHSCFAQAIELSFYCGNVKIISEYTGDTIERCELFLDREKALKKLGNNYVHKMIEHGMYGPYESYEFGRDAFQFN